MKKKIVVCCEDMLKHFPATGIPTEPVVLPFSPMNPAPFAVASNLHWRFCPWCGTKLPFPYEEAE